MLHRGQDGSLGSSKCLFSKVLKNLPLRPLDLPVCQILLPRSVLYCRIPALAISDLAHLLSEFLKKDYLYFETPFLLDATKSHLVYGCRVSSCPVLRSSSRSWSFLLFDNSIQVSEFSSFGFLVESQIFRFFEFVDSWSLLHSNFSSFGFECLSDGDNFLWQLFDNVLTTVWQLFDNFLTTFDNYLTTFWQLFDNFLTTFDNFLTTFWQFFDIIFDLFFDNFMSNFDFLFFLSSCLFQKWVRPDPT
jgi:hypothetical protein